MTPASTLLLAAVLLGGAPVPAAPARVPLLVELFTSEGCSSCPPADALLARLSARQDVPGVELLLLSEHVDYWNRLGWRDPFSSPQFSARQQAYAARLSGGRSYTPQAVVHGLVDVVGHDEPALRQALAAAAALPRGTLALTLRAGASPGELLLAAEATALPADGELLYAVVEDGLASRVTAGENEGRTLPHAGVVRALGSLGVTRGRALRAEGRLELDPRWERASLKVVAFVQVPAGPIAAAAQVPVPR